MTCYLDEQQRNERDRDPNHEIKQCIAIILDEAQDAFTNRSTARLEMEEFMCVFAEARNSKISFISSSQRLTDIAKAVRAKQLKVLGKLDSEDLTPALRRIEKAYNLDFSNMKPRNWYFEGKTFLSPEFKQVGKPYIINDQIKKQWLDNLPKPKTLAQKILAWLLTPRKQTSTTSENLGDSEPKSVYNESEGMDEEIEDDGLIEAELGL